MSQIISFVTVDVFTNVPYQGNPLAICKIAKDQQLSDTVLQAIAREFNLSETVFLYEDTPASWKLRIFTTEMELPFAGHPTIGTAHHVLTTHGLASASLWCNAGEIRARLRDGRSYAEIPSDFHHHRSSLSSAEIQELQTGLLAYPDGIVRTDVVSPVKGMTFVVSELSSLAALSAVRTTGKKPGVVLDQGWNESFVGTAYYVADGEHGGAMRYRTRMIETTMEDPATGSMSCGLGCLLALQWQQEDASFEFVQGVEMGRESHIGVDVKILDGKVAAVTLHGSAVPVMSGSLRC